jgi:hypothetical protein
VSTGPHRWEREDGWIELAPFDGGGRVTRWGGEPSAAAKQAFAWARRQGWPSVIATDLDVDGRSSLGFVEEPRELWTRAVVSLGEPRVWRLELQNPLWAEPGPDQTCATCVWRFEGGPGPVADRCRRHGGQRVPREAPACPAWEGRLDCVDCGACCRAGFTAVEVTLADRFVDRWPGRVERDGQRLWVRREQGACVCLRGGPEWTCEAYEDRPTACAAFPVAGAGCLKARRRLGLTR